MSKILDDLMIYKQYTELIYYTEMITDKFPKHEKFSLVATIKNTTYLGMKQIISSYKEFDRYQKIEILNHMDSSLKFLKVLVRVSYRRKYISHKNYTAWSKKITNIGNLLGGWIKSCQKR